MEKANNPKNFILSTGIAGCWVGSCGNVYLLENAADLFRLGALLIDAGFEVEPQSAFAKRRGVSRQAVKHWIEREGQYVAIQFRGWLGRPVLYVVS